MEKIGPKYYSINDWHNCYFWCCFFVSVRMTTDTFLYLFMGCNKFRQKSKKQNWTSDINKSKEKIKLLVSKKLKWSAWNCLTKTWGFFFQRDGFHWEKRQEGILKIKGRKDNMFCRSSNCITKNSSRDYKRFNRNDFSNYLSLI